MFKREYYSVRTGKDPGQVEISFEELKLLVLSAYEKFEGQGYFANAFGQYCVDEGRTVGSVGSNIELFFLQRLRKRGLWPIPVQIVDYAEDDLFSVIELCHDLVSRPQSRRYHEWDNCGYHYGNFDADSGKEEFRAEINLALGDFKPRYSLSERGEVMETPESGLEALVAQPLPVLEPESVEQKVETAIRMFHRFNSTPDDRKEAIRTLADVFEYLRPKLKEVISSKDEADLFNIANNFAIRHHNPQQ